MNISDVLVILQSSISSPWDAAKTQQSGAWSALSWTEAFDSVLITDPAIMIGRWIAMGVLSPDLADAPEAKVVLTLRRRAALLIGTTNPNLSGEEMSIAVGHLVQLALSTWRDANPRQSREPITARIRTLLVAQQQSKADLRCWICGVDFPEDLIDSFISMKALQSDRRSLVDFIYPRGATSNHLIPVVDHVTPFSTGGADDVRNMRIACSFCNRAKWHFVSTFGTADSGSTVYRHPKLGPYQLPQPLWVARLLAMSHGCVVCERDQAEVELVVTPLPGMYSLNPTNLRVYCVSHDVMSVDRYVASP